MRASAAVVAIVATLFVASGATASTRGGGATGTWYTVAFSTSTLPANVDKLVADAGGTIAVRLPELGGLAVVSSNAGFVARMSKIATVAAADTSTKTSLEPIEDKIGQNGNHQGGQTRHGGRKTSGVGVDPQPEPDQLGAEQWDKMRMDVSLAGSYKVSRGRPEVRVAFTDTGVDATHPDIKPNLDTALSTSFLPGDPGIQDGNGHGTWVASAVGAPINRIGISGVAPNVSLVALKTQDAEGNGLLVSYDEALVYAAKKGIDIVSASIIAYGPTCDGVPKTQPCDNADYLLAQRAVDYARDHGVTVLAAIGNENLDVSDRNTLGDLARTDPTVTDPGPFAEMPATLRGVIGVGATGYLNEKTYYSNYGVGAVDVVAPGGDPFFQPAPGYTTEGGLLGAWSSTAPPPGHATTDCVGAVCAPYGWQIGTSMATPNVAGVAALIISRYGTFDEQHGNNQNGNNQNGDNNRGSRRNEGGTHLRPEQVERYLTGTAVPLACPNPATVDYGFDTATCKGGTRNNGFYGAGLVDALAAVTRAGGNR